MSADFREPLPIPKWRRPGEKLDIVVEGVGNLIETKLGPALEKFSRQHEGQISVTFADDRELWELHRTPARVIKRREATIARMPSWGARYVDKSGDRADYLRLIEGNDTDVVVIATSNDSHCYIASTWLNHCELIFVEKPLDDNLDAARRLALRLPTKQPAVFAFDHYRARFFLSPEVEDKLVKLSLEGGWKELTFYFLEDGSGGEMNGPIENEGRERTLRHGIIRDLMPHIFAVIAYFGRPETVRITDVSVAQYRGVKYDPDLRADIEGETFAQIRFTFEDLHHRRVIINGTSFIGKGIRGSNTLGITGDVKLLVIRAHNGNHVEIDFKTSSGTLTDLRGLVVQVKLEAEPYLAFLEAVYSYEHARGDRPLVLGFETGKRILEILTDITCAVPPKDLLPTYQLGDRGGSPPWLEDLIEGSNIDPSLSTQVPELIQPYPPNDRRKLPDRRVAPSAAAVTS